MNKNFDVIIVGGGTAGISIAARLRNERPHMKLAIIDPASNHYYQPLWTLVGGGAAKFSQSVRSMRSLIPDGVEWIQAAVTQFFPDKNTVETAQNQQYGYQYLVVCPGIQVNWGQIKGLPEALGRGGVCSNYSATHVPYTWECIRHFKGGEAIFTFPATPVKCAGAPQKIMYLAEDYWRRHGLRQQSAVTFASAGDKIFGIKKYADSLSRIVEQRGIQTRFKHNLVEIRGASREAVFRNTADQSEVVMKYDLLHATPPMSAPDFIKQSPLANADGWVDVHKHTLQHTRYPNVFAAGDASSLPTSRTGAAIRKEAPVLVHNLLATMNSKPADAQYNGYTSCPLVTGYGKLILAEFDYNGEPCETFSFDQSRERLSMYLLKKYVLPPMYWYGMLKGRA